MIAKIKLIQMYKFLSNELANFIINSTIDITLYKLKFTFRSGIVLHVRYNDFNEYGYQIMYSNRKGDYERFDNYDKNWDINTAPHHFHSRNNQDVKASQMVGDPNIDGLILRDFIKKLLL